MHAEYVLMHYSGLVSVYSRWKWNYFGSPPTYLALLSMGFHVSTVTTAALLNRPAIIFLFKPTKWRQIPYKYVFWHNTGDGGEEQPG